MKRNTITLGLVLFLSMTVIDCKNDNSNESKNGKSNEGSNSASGSGESSTENGQLSADYVGCYVDSNPRDLDGPMKDFGSNCTIESCALFCWEKNYKYAGLQYRFYLLKLL